MKTLKAAIVFSIVLVMGHYVKAQDQALNSQDLQQLVGKWKGKITYQDYSSGKSFSMPVIFIFVTNYLHKNEVIWQIEYPEEPKANQTDTLRLTDDGKYLDGVRIISKSQVDGKYEVVTEEEGKDGNDNKAATIRHYYIWSKNSLRFRKEVRFKDADKWMVRNEYVLTR